MVRIDDDLYEYVESHKRDDETFSETIERLIGGPSLLSLAGILSDDDADRFREAVADADATATEDMDAVTERFEGTSE